ncbi:hypothetical protein HDU67_005936 [Dinochytrium kinnereticum]|nr:hypothetical protein HDU67_005936 [Dinochytrium kinnereticum]
MGPPKRQQRGPQKGQQKGKGKGKFTGRRPREEEEEEEEQLNYELDIVDIDPEDDEEIDEDEAFGSSDDEKYSSFFTASEGSSSKKDAKKGKPEESMSLLDEGPSIRRGSKINVDEDDESDDEDEDLDALEDDGTLVNISDMLDAPTEQPSKAAPSAGEKKKASTKGKGKAAMEALMPQDLEDDLDDGFEMDEDLISDDDDEYNLDVDEDEEVGGMKSLADYVDGLDSKNKSASRKRKLPEIEEALPPSEFNVPSRNRGDDERGPSKRKLNITDLITGISDEVGFSSLRKQVDDFAGENAAKKTKRTLTVGQAEAAPLPARLQSQMEREAAYSAAKKEVSKWAYTVKKNREADQLVFPMNEPSIESMTSSSLVGKFKSETTLEQEIEKVLLEKKLTDKQQIEMEELEMRELTKEELERRRAELAKMRSLLFYSEQKQKKIAKIKSKVYRKLQKKAKEKAGATAEELAGVDPELAKEMLLKQHADRIKERMTLKHKGGSKWAKDMMSRRDRGAGTREALMDQFNRHAELTKKITGLDSDDDGDDNDSDDHFENDDPSETLESSQSNAFKSLDDLSLDNSNAPTKGVFAMKFMQRGHEKQQKALREQIEQAKEDILSGNVDGSGHQDSDEEYEGIEGLSSEDEEEKKKAIKAKDAVKRKQVLSSGRMAFAKDGEENGRVQLSDDDESFVPPSLSHSVKVTGPVSITLKSKKASTAKLQPLFEVENFEVEEANDTSYTAIITPGDLSQPAKHLTDTKKPASTKKQEAKKPSQHLTPAPLPSDDEKHNDSAADDSQESNPWLDPHEVKTGRSYKKSQTTSKGEMRDRVVAAQKKQTALDDVKLNLDYKKLEKSVPGFIQKQAVSGGAKAKDGGGKAKVVTSTVLQEASDEDSDDDFGMTMAGRTTVSEDKVHIGDLTKMDVMQMAFANDDVFADFEEEKTAIVDKDKPKDEDLTLPGWGSWAGNGVAPKENVVIRKAKPHEGVDASKRKDAKLKNVIISEKRNKKVTKYMSTQVPHGFDNREQYEESIRLPMGREWNATSAHGKLVAPKVVTKMGKVIAPLAVTLQPPGKAGGGKKGRA